MSNIAFIASPEGSAAEPVILAIDTSSRRAGLAISKGEEVIATLTICNNLPHSQIVFSNIRSLLGFAGIETREINAFAAATGPGSFTGLRVGLAAVKGLADSLGKPCLGVDSLDLFALASGFDGAHLVMIDAGKSEVYGGLREVAAGDVVNRSAVDKVGKPSFILGELTRDLKTRPLIITGNGARKHQEEVQAFMAKSLVTEQKISTGPYLIGRDATIDTSAALAIRACRLLKSSQISPVNPHYVRPSDAVGRS